MSQIVALRRGCSVATLKDKVEKSAAGVTAESSTVSDKVVLQCNAGKTEY